MAYSSPNTPEALLARSDSRNPTRTCQGITNGGRKCRRDIGPSSTPGGRRVSAPPVTGAALSSPASDSTSLYCWQHKHQAATLPTTQERTSMDTLVANLADLGIHEASNGPAVKHKVKHEASGYTSVPTSKPRTKQKSSFWGSLCCFTTTKDGDSDRLEVVRHKRRTQAHQAQPEMSITRLLARPSQHKTYSADARLTTVPSSSPHRTSRPRPTSTTDLLNLIPPSLPPQPTSALLAELSKPISIYDEPGYIYTFWLTDSKLAPPPEDTTSSLLTPSSTLQPPPRQSNNRRHSAILSEYSTTSASPRSPVVSPASRKPHQRDRILLKIGRANNVHRRMSEWQRQCGYNLSLIRFYPYVPSSSLSPRQPPLSPAPGSPTPPSQSHRPTSNISAAIRMVPYAHRVERLIHLELSEQRARKQERCSACGREHREWFEVEGTSDGVRRVDEVVRRWVGWAEGLEAGPRAGA